MTWPDCGWNSESLEDLGLKEEVDALVGVADRFGLSDAALDKEVRKTLICLRDKFPEDKPIFDAAETGTRRMKLDFLRYNWNIYGVRERIAVAAGRVGGTCACWLPNSVSHCARQPHWCTENQSGCGGEAWEPRPADWPPEPYYCKAKDCQITKEVCVSYWEGREQWDARRLAYSKKICGNCALVPKN